MDLTFIKKPKTLYVVFSCVILFLLLDPLNISLLNNNQTKSVSVLGAKDVNAMQPFNYIAKSISNEIVQKVSDTPELNYKSHNQLPSTFSFDEKYNIMFSNIPNIELARSFAYRLYHDGFHVVLRNTFEDGRNTSSITVGEFSSQQRALNAYMKLANTQKYFQSLFYKS